MTDQQGTRKVRVGFVISDKMDKTRVIAVHWSQRHPVYHRHVRRLTKFKAHDEQNQTHMGDRVRIVETRPLSKDKRWRVLEVVERAEQVDVKPEEVGATLIEELEHRPAPDMEIVAEVVAPPQPPPQVVAEPVAQIKKPRTRKKAVSEAEQAVVEPPVAKKTAEKKPVVRKPRAKKTTKAEESK